MIAYSINSYDDAIRLVQRYRLDQFDFEIGTVAGFASWLFIQGGTLWDLRTVADAIDEYKGTLSTTVARGLDLDELNLREAESLQKSLVRHARRRADLADYIRSTKLAPGGSRTWSAVAELATTQGAAQLSLLNGWPSAMRQDVFKAIAGLERFKSYMANSNALGYVGGRDMQLDRMLRMDIERFDAKLMEAPAWCGREEDRSYEMCALFGLMGDTTSPNAVGGIGGAQRVFQS